MPNSPLSLALPRRLSVSFKLGWLFLVLVTLALGNLVLSNVLYDSIANIASFINQSGQLRYLSQKTAFNSASLAREPSMAASAAGLESEREFEMRYAGVAREIEHFHPLMRRSGDHLDHYLQQIDQTWQRQRGALARVRSEPMLMARLSAQREVSIHALQLLGQTDDLVNALEKSARSARQRVNFIMSLVLALEILLLLGAFCYVRSRVCPPIHNMISLFQRFSAGKQTLRKD